VALDRFSMAEWLERHVPGVLDSRVGEWLDQTMCGWGYAGPSSPIS
jgi:hypothetical protein